MPEPLSLVASIGGVLSVCVKTIKSLYDFYETYDNAKMTVLSIHSTCTTMAISLELIENLVLKYPHEAANHLEIMDLALPGCEILLKTLQRKIDKVMKSDRSEGSKTLNHKAKFTFALWRKGDMLALSGLLKNQTGALNTYITLLSHNVQFDIKEEVGQVMKVVDEIRKRYPDVSKVVPPSIHTSIDGQAPLHETELQKTRVYCRAQQSSEAKSKEGTSIIVEEMDSESEETLCLANPSLSHECLLVGVDFGVKTSSIAWAFRRGLSASFSANDITMLTNWPSGGGAENVPSVIATKKGHVQCGYEAEHAAIPLLKLMLAAEGATKYSESKIYLDRLDEAESALRGYKNSVVHAVGEFFQHLWTQLLVAVRDLQYSNAQTPVIIVLTMPSKVGRAHRRGIHLAAIRAGILKADSGLVPTLHFITEPEAVHRTVSENLKRRHEFQLGQTMVFCNFGELLVDATSYTVEKCYPLELTIATSQKSDTCGAYHLDLQFERRLSEWLGARFSPAKTCRQKYETFLREDWERGLKRDFDGRSDTYKLNIPRGIFAADAARLHVLTREEISAVFDDTMQRVEALIDDQLEKLARKLGILPVAIILSGSLGNEKYVHWYLKEAFPDIEVIQDPALRSSVLSHGAVHYANSIYQAGEEM